jgi:hypothetical protein
MSSSKRWSTGAVIVAFLCGTIGYVACGARSDLAVPNERRPRRDAGPDAAPDVAPDVPEDVPEDVPPDIPPDMPPECTEDVTYIYVVTGSNNLWAYKPMSNQFELRGMLNCPAFGGATPFSMAVSVEGIAHIVYNNGQLFRASVEDADCELTTFEPNQMGFQLFGMGYAPNEDDFGETLYVAEISFDELSKGLASIDTDTYELSFIGAFSENPGNALELTPTGSGPLWGYFLNVPGPGGTLVEIDTNTAEILQSIGLPAGMNSSALAVAWWGGDFYIFTTSGGGTQVTRYDPDAGNTDVVTSFGEVVVGAGVSTCAPSERP